MGQTGSVHWVRDVGGRGDEVLEVDVEGGPETEVVKYEEPELGVVALEICCGIARLGVSAVVLGGHMEPKRSTAMTSVRMPSAARSWRWFCGFVAQTCALKKARKAV